MANISDFTLRARSSGFLDEDEYAGEIIQKDAEYLKSVNITPKQIADILENYFYKGKYHNWDLGSRFKQLSEGIDWNEENNECPCGDPEHNLRSNPHRYIIGRNSDGRELECNTKLFSVIQNHGFFGGYKSKYRIDPKTIVEFFDMKSDVDYALKYTLRRAWMNTCSCSHLLDHHEESIKNIYRLSLNDYGCSEKGYQAFLVPSYLIEYCKGYKSDPEIYNYDDLWTHFYKFATKDHTYSTPEESEQGLKNILKIANDYISTRKCSDGTYLIIFNPRRESGRWYIEDLNTTFNVRDVLTTIRLTTEKDYFFDQEFFT